MTPRPVRVLELRSVRGPGGGPEKTILLGAAATDPARIAVTVCYVRDARDAQFAIGARAAALGVEYVEVHERHSIDPAVWRPLRALVRDRRIDVIHAHEYKTDLLALLLARATGAAPLATAHGWTGHSWRERAVYYPVDRRLLARFPRVIAVSSDVRRALVAAGCRPERVDVVLNGIDPQRFRRDPARVPDARRRLGLVPGEIAVVAVGRLEPQKRFDLLIEAVAALKSRQAGIRLFIAGEGSVRPALERAVADRGLARACTLLGHVSDVSAVHHAADLFVQSADYEGTPNAVLEAMAFEVPVVATDAGGTREIVRDRKDGLIVAKGDASALAAAIEDVMADPDAARTRAASARRRVETELSFDARMERVNAIYEELADARSSRR